MTKRLESEGNPLRIALLGNYAPRLCGIATFTTDLAESLVAGNRADTVHALAMNDTQGGYDYPERVRYTLDAAEPEDYIRAAQFLNRGDYHVTCIQHEYGIFGGAAGRHLLELVPRLRMPVVTTLHTVMKEPTKDQRQVLQELIRLSDRVVVMSRIGAQLLTGVYGEEKLRGKIAHIPHGIPDIPFMDTGYHKEDFGLEGRNVILTFGLLSPNKGIEHMLKALPQVVERHPRTTYVVLGATHPHVKAKEGEKYRQFLQDLARELGVADHVVFQNSFVDIEELGRYLMSADIYVTPYANEAQVVSGTLAYAMGSGTAVISTPYWHAREMLAKGRGRLVPFANTEKLAASVLELLDDPDERQVVRKRSYTYTRGMTWPQVAEQYRALFLDVQEFRLKKHAPLPKPKLTRAGVAHLPELDLTHLIRLTDDTGLLQHAKHDLPDRSFGYCTDDNARALLVTLATQELQTAGQQVGVAAALQERYLAFLQHALPTAGVPGAARARFRNFMTYERTWMETAGSEDSHARALWALGAGVAAEAGQQHSGLVWDLFRRALPAARELHHPRPKAFALLGLEGYLGRYHGDTEAVRIRREIADALVRLLRKRSRQDWPWVDAQVTYDNARIPQALLGVGLSLESQDMLDLGMETLEWLLEIQTRDGHFCPLGNIGWYVRRHHRARFDQQPLEASAMIDACLQAALVTGNSKWEERAVWVFGWFLGDNDLGLPVYDVATGGCRDGLQARGMNLNQGAESTLAWLLALTRMHRLHASRPQAGSRLKAGARSKAGVGPEAGARPGPGLGIRSERRPDKRSQQGEGGSPPPSALPVLESRR